MRHRLNLDRLSQLMESSRVSQNHWAIRLGLSRGHWSDIVNGKHPYPSAKTRERMIEVFGASASDLFIAESGQSNPDVDFRIAISGRFELTAELGQGGMGTVYFANDLALGRLVALKVVSAEAVAGVGADELLKEIRVVSRLQHPHLLPLFDAGTGAGRPFYVMPWVRGGSLGARLRARGRLPLPEVITLVRGLASALGYARDQRVLHCDIKPENIVLDGDHPYLMDFGIARVLHSEANEWSGLRKDLDFSAGTPAYVSPEQAAGDRELDPRSDVYSLACVVYEMLTGRPPFSGRNTQETVSLRFREAAPPLEQLAPDVPASVAAVVRRAMSTDPAQRPDSATEFTAELEVAARGASRLRTALALGATRARRELRRVVSGSPAPSRRTGWLRRAFDSVGMDVAYAFRQRRRSPGLTVTALLTLALGLGLSTAVFALVDGVVLRPLPFPAQERLVSVQSMDSLGQTFPWVSAANWHDWAVQNQTLEGVAIHASARASVLVNAGARGQRVEWAQVSPNLPAVVGMRLLAGRTFDSLEVAAGGPGGGGALVSESLWRGSLGSTPLASRPEISVDGATMPVIGVVARGDEFPAGTEVWTAYRYRPVGGAARNNINYFAVGRLREGASLDRARADLSAIARGIHAMEPVALYSYGVGMIPLRDSLVGDAKQLLSLLTGAVAVLLLIACANLASASLAQAASREREMAVRSALGAARWRIVRQVLVDHALLALAGGALGVALAWVLIRTTSILALSSLPRVGDVRINVSVLGAAFVLSLLAALLTGLLPALRASRSAPNAVIGGTARSIATGSRGMPGRLLACAQVAMTMMLVTGAGLLVQSLRSVLAQPLGFQTAGIATARVTLGRPLQARDSAAMLGYWDGLVRALREEPGVLGAALATSVPLHGGGRGFIEVEHQGAVGAAAGYRIVSEEYFRTLGVTMREGRDFSASDAAGGERIAVVNASMARQFWPDESALGKRVRALSMEPTAGGAAPAWITVVGVADDTRHFGYTRDPEPEMYVLYRQLPAWRLQTMTAIARSTAPENVLLQQLGRAVTRLDPTAPADLGLLADAAVRNTATERFAMIVFQAFGGLSLLLAAIGIYGVLAFSVARRTQELAVRAALGADRTTLLRMIARSGAMVVLAGLAIGTVGVVLGAKLIESLLYDVSPRDPLIIAAAAMAIAVAGGLATWLPALRATRADPMTALRGE